VAAGSGAGLNKPGKHYCARHHNIGGRGLSVFGRQIGGGVQADHGPIGFAPFECQQELTVSFWHRADNLTGQSFARRQQVVPFDGMPPHADEAAREFSLMSSRRTASTSALGRSWLMR